MALMKLEFWAYLNRADTLYYALCFSTTKFVDCPICPPARSITGDKIGVMSPSDVDLLNEAATEVIRGVPPAGRNGTARLESVTEISEVFYPSAAMVASLTDAPRESRE